MKQLTAVQQYLDDVDRTVGEALGSKVDAMILTGSAALGDFDLRFSDIDLMFVVSGRLDESEVANLVSGISQDAIPCPAVGLDLTVYQRAALDPLVTPVPYELGLESGPNWGIRFHGRGAEAELVLDLALAREHGLAQRGPSPKTLISTVPRSWILDAVLSTIRWHQSAIHDPFHDPTGSQAVLNACRGLYYCEGECFVSKSDAGKWAESRGWRIATQALAARLEPSRILPRAPIAEFLNLAVREVEASRRAV